MSSKQLQARVQAALNTAESPLKTSELAEMVGKTAKSVAAALKDIGALRVPDSYPAEWTIDESHVSANVVGPQKEGTRYTVISPTMKNIVTAWNESRIKLGETIIELAIEPDSDPEKLSERFAKAAGNFAAIAFELEKHSKKPDWYLILTESE